MIYGRKNTIHKTEFLNVEVDKKGKVVAVWFRCRALPFVQSVADKNRAEEMTTMYSNTDAILPLIAVELKEK